MPSRAELLDELQELAFLLVDRLSAPTDAAPGSLTALTVLQIRCVKTIRAMTGCKVVDIGRALAISVPNASRLVDRLVRHGWVERLPDPRDRRVKRLALTPMAEDVVRRSRAAHLAELEACARGLRDEQIECLVVAIRALTQDA